MHINQFVYKMVFFWLFPKKNGAKKEHEKWCHTQFVVMASFWLAFYLARNKTETSLFEVKATSTTSTTFFDAIPSKSHESLRVKMAK